MFFRQKRYGLDGQEIKIWKFRTMRAEEAGTEKPRRGDPRVTRLGAVMRRLSLDELPLSRWGRCSRPGSPSYRPCNG